MEIQYKAVALEELDEVCGLVDKAVQTMIRNKIYQWDEIYPAREDFEEDICRRQLYAGVMDGRIAVIYVLNKECDEQYKNGSWKHEKEPYYIIHRLCVNPAFQNQGIASRTLRHIEEQLTAWGIHAIRLDAFSENPFALKMYANLGYHRVGCANFRKGKFYLMEKYF